MLFLEKDINLIFMKIKYSIIYLLVLLNIHSCQKNKVDEIQSGLRLGYDFMMLSKGDYLLPISENVFITWNSKIGDLNYKITYNDSINLIQELLYTVNDTTSTIVENCYLEQENNKLTKGQLAFWVLWYIKPFSFKDALNIEIDSWGLNHKDTIYSSCKYPNGFMSFAFKNKDKIASKLTDYYNSKDDSSWVEMPVFRYNNATNPRRLNKE